MTAIYILLSIIGFFGLIILITGFFVPRYSNSLKRIGANILGTVVFLILVAYLYTNVLATIVGS